MQFSKAKPIIYKQEAAKKIILLCYIEVSMAILVFQNRDVKYLTTFVSKGLTFS